MEVILKVKDLCKTYIVNKRQNHVLRNVNFEVGKGSVRLRKIHSFICGFRYGSPDFGRGGFLREKYC